MLSRVARWPWPLLRLLEKPLDRCLLARKEIAPRQLLDEDVGALESTTRKIRKKCPEDLQAVCETGQLQAGSCLHGILAMTAQQVKLDSGMLESLNSMIKVAVSHANNSNTSLELLSSRVNTRKTVTMLSEGSNRLQDVRPPVEALAKSSVLYQGKEAEVLSQTFRWSPPEPKALMEAELAKYDPSMVIAEKEKYAVRFHTALVKQLHAARSEDGDAGQADLLLGVQVQPCAGAASVYLLAELTGRSSWLLPLDTLRADGRENELLHRLTADMTFVWGVKAIAQHLPDSASRAAAQLSLLRLREVTASDQETELLAFQVISAAPVVKLHAKRVASRMNFLFRF